MTDAEDLAVQRLAQTARAFAKFTPRKNASGAYARALEDLIQSARVFAQKSDEVWATELAEAKRERAEPTHRCKVCGALWTDFGVGGWSLSAPAPGKTWDIPSCGPCCDNPPAEVFRENVEPLSPACGCGTGTWCFQHMREEVAEAVASAKRDCAEFELLRHAWAARLELDRVLRLHEPYEVWRPEVDLATDVYAKAKAALEDVHGRVSEAGRGSATGGDGACLGEHASPGDRGAVCPVSSEGARREPDSGLLGLPTETEVEAGAPGTPGAAGRE